jgi:hypothetical protein
MVVQRKNYLPLNPALRPSLRYADELLPGTVTMRFVS